MYIYTHTHSTRRCVHRRRRHHHHYHHHRCLSRHFYGGSPCHRGANIVIKAKRKKAYATVASVSPLSLSTGWTLPTWRQASTFPAVGLYAGLPTDNSASDQSRTANESQRPVRLIPCRTKRKRRDDIFETFFSQIVFPGIKDAPRRAFLSLPHP